MRNIESKVQRSIGKAFNRGARKHHHQSPSISLLSSSVRKWKREKIPAFWFLWTPGWAHRCARYLCYLDDQYRNPNINNIVGGRTPPGLKAQMMEMSDGRNLTGLQFILAPKIDWCLRFSKGSLPGRKITKLWKFYEWGGCGGRSFWGVFPPL